MEANTISVFEYEKLIVNQKGFNRSHFNALVKFNDLHGGKYFTVGYNKITFKSYVGVLQVGNKVIEILPKADNTDSSSNGQMVAKWQSVLLTMLQKTGYIRLNETEKAVQNVNKQNLLDIYLYEFLKETERLIHAGLVKKYHRNIRNESVLKGRLLIHKQIQHNLIHQEKFYTEHTVYDTNNRYNAIIKKSLEIIKDISSNAPIKLKAIQYLYSFEGVDTWKGIVSELENLKFDRKTEQYEYAILLSYLIINNFCPDFTAGNKHVLAILFNMNQLFESYVYKSLKKYESAFSEQNLSIRKQTKKTFWGDKTIRPDIIASYKTSDLHTISFVIDTKWKVVNEDAPSDNDLKQMFVYNFQFGVVKSILFYPKTGQSNKPARNYETSEFAKEIEHGCEMYFAELFDENDRLCEDFARIFLNKNIVKNI